MSAVFKVDDRCWRPTLLAQVHEGEDRLFSEGSQGNPKKHPMHAGVYAYVLLKLNNQVPGFLTDGSHSIISLFDFVFRDMTYLCHRPPWRQNLPWSRVARDFAKVSKAYPNDVYGFCNKARMAFESRSSSALEISRYTLLAYGASQAETKDAAMAIEAGFYGLNDGAIIDGIRQTFGMKVGPKSLAKARAELVGFAKLY